MAAVFDVSWETFKSNVLAGDKVFYEPMPEGYRAWLPKKDYVLKATLQKDVNDSALSDFESAKAGYVKGVLEEGL